MSSTHKDSSHSTKTFSSTSGNRARDRMNPEDFWDFDLPISRKGRFFQDSSFEDTRSDFDKKVKDILSKWGDDDVLADKWADDDDDLRHTSNLSRYRKLRSRNLSDDNQAFTVTNREDAHKIVLDVMDFVAGDVKVKVVGELELVVEGRLEAGPDGGSPRTFRRRFSLPQQTDMDAITSVMSADGILTITAPKKGSQRKEDSSVPKHQTSSNKQNTESTRSFTTAGDNGASSMKEEANTRAGQSFRDVPFKKKGRFFDDSCFEDSRWDFDKTVKDILNKWGEGDVLADKWDEDDDDDLRHTSNLRRYRRLRSHNLSDDNQAFTVTNKDDAHKIVLDVMDFVAGDVKVKMVGELELVVEGRLEAGSDRGSPRTFRRRFSLPQQTDMDAITSVMSADGILTITAPKKVSRGKDTQANAVNKENLTDSCASASHTSSNTSGNTSTSNISSSNISSSNISSMKSNMAEVQQSAEKLNNESKQEISQPTQNTINTNVAPAEDVPAQVPAAATTQQSSQSFSLSQETTKESIPSGAPQAVSVNKEEEENKAMQQTDQKESASHVTKTVERSEAQQGSGRSITLPITTRGQFFIDSFFEDTWNNYQDAVKDVLARWDDRSSPVTSDDMTCYRKLRTRDMRDENQAISTSEDETSYKFVVDVHGFVEGGNVTVNVMDDNQLVVEGRVERQEAGSRASNHFMREFVLAQDVDQESISAVMSSDEVLTIIVPKKKLQQGAVKEEAVSVSSKEEQVKETQATEAVRVSAEEHSHSSAAISVGQESVKEADEKEIVIPVQIDRSSEVNIAGSDASSQSTEHEKKLAFESQVNFNDDENYKKSAAGKDCAFTDESVTDTVHRRLEEEQGQGAQAAGEGEGDADKKKRVIKRVRREVDEAYKNRLIPISTKGNFYEDKDFVNYKDNYLTAVKDVLHKFRVPVDSAGEIAAYRDLRQRDLKLENQAAHIDDYPCSQTVVLDVFDFLDGEVTAEVVDGRELVVRGFAKRREGSSLITLTFIKPIPLPENADLYTISAFMSSDGVLVITIPKSDECYEVADLGKEMCAENRNLRDTSLNLEGMMYRMSPHRTLIGEDRRSSGRDRSSDRL